MIVTPNSIKALMTSFRKDFQGGLDGAPSQYQKIAMTVPSSSKSNTYGWLGNAPQLREWVGARVVNQMAASAYTVANKTYEGTVGISRDDFEDDNLGVYSPMFSELGRSAAVQPDELVFGLLKDGFNQACYDGQNFFDTDHPVYPKVDGTGRRSRWRTSTSNQLAGRGQLVSAGLLPRHQAADLPGPPKG